MAEKLNILCVTTDTQLLRSLQDRTKSFAVPVMFIPCTDSEKLAESAKKYAIDAAILDDTFIDPLNPAALTALKTTLHSQSVTKFPFFLFSVERDAAALRKIMAVGLNDIFTKPVDHSMFFQKLQVHLPHIHFLKDNLLFSMKVDSTLDLALECKLVSVSEYGANIRVNRELRVTELFTIYGKMFGQQNGECIGRVMSCVASKEEKDKFDVSLVFIAPKKEILTGIRLWIKQEYVRAREASR